MKILKKILVPFIMGVAVWTVISCDKNLSGVNDVVVAEFDRLGVQPTNSSEIKSITLPENLHEDAHDEFITRICDQGGYDLNPYAGQTLTLTNVNIKGRCDDRYSIRVFVLSTDETIACAYFAIREGSSAAPGLWPVNSPSCTIPVPAAGCR